MRFDNRGQGKAIIREHTQKRFKGIDVKVIGCREDLDAWRLQQIAAEVAYQESRAAIRQLRRAKAMAIVESGKSDPLTPQEEHLYQAVIKLHGVRAEKAYRNNEVVEFIQPKLTLKQKIAYALSEFFSGVFEK